jgi:hypothetical protein
VSACIRRRSTCCIDISEDRASLTRFFVFLPRVFVCRIRAHSVLSLSGAGQSGKSTVAKQMKIIHMDGFSGACGAALGAELSPGKPPPRPQTRS